ncbi:hypothetical protein Ddye_006862 [Dipteronia dyeriana]|uniref:Reverse transcriptase zinc-binding domain-containing protein n=1 Tax=Dipteronia dyeriana TaxID=168575 RepID=A0AAD9XIV1_9ROSI|nr:hypothetical protein Ddye_006862 [Dipteronia dyeriana]
MDEKCLRWNWLGPHVKSDFTKAVSNVLKDGSRSKLIADGLKVVVISGDRADFWRDLCVDYVPLMVASPRIFAIANHKFGSIKDFGQWSESSWVWEVKLRSLIFDWEQAEWKLFKDFLGCIQISKRIPDMVAWSFLPNGDFTAGSFRRGLESDHDSNKTDFNCVWKGCCPPKIEFVIWQLYRDRIMVKEVLNRFGLNQGLYEQCVLCRAGSESSDHLFCTAHGQVVYGILVWIGGVFAFVLLIQSRHGWMDEGVYVIHPSINVNGIC